MTLVSISQDSWITQLPQDAWGHVLSYVNIDDLKNYRLISKVFFESIVEKGCFAMCLHFQLGDAAMGLSFRRIMNLGNLIEKWTHPKDAESIFLRDLPLAENIPDNVLVSLILLPSHGINLYDYRPKLIDSSNQKEIKYITQDIDGLEHENELVDHIRVFAVHLFKKTPLYSIQDFLEIARTHLSKQSDINALIRQLVYMTLHIFPNHPGKNDLVKLITGNIDDLYLALSYDKIKADRLLNESFFQLTKSEIKFLIIFYLCNYDVEGLIKLLNKIKENASQIDRKIVDTFLVCFDEKDEYELIFVKFLILYKNKVAYIIGKLIVSHLAESGNIYLLEKLEQKYGFQNDLSCFHYAKTAAVAEKLFASVPQYIDNPLYDRSPLLTALMKNNIEVAEFLLNKNCGLNNDKTTTLIRFLFSKKFLNESKWFILKDLIYRVIRAVAICFGAIAAFCIACVIGGYAGYQLGVLLQYLLTGAQASFPLV